MTVSPTKHKKIAILHQGCVPVYRRSFFERLSKDGKNKFHIFYGAPPSNTSLQAAEGPFSFESTEVKNLELKFGGRVLIYQPVLLKYLFGGFEGAVIGHEFKFLSSLLIFLISKLLRRPIVWWGFGYRKDYGAWQGKGRRKLKDKVAIWAADHLARFGDGYLAYTEAGKEHLIEIGVPANRVQVLRNTIDIEEQIELAQTANQLPFREIRTKLGLANESLVLLYIGRLVPRKKVDLLVKFGLQNQRVRDKKVEILIIGDGEERASLESMARGRENIHFLGAIDPADPVIAKAMRVSSAVVIPGYLGLAINHAFAHGRPVITQDHDYHSPEIDYLTNGVDGLLLPQDDEAFCLALIEYIQKEELQNQLSENALKTRESLRMEHMVRSFDCYISRLLSTKRHSNE